SCVHPTSVNCLASTRNMRWLFSGGDDGFIRKFDFAATLNGEQGLTQTQKHGLVDSIEKGGVLSSVWENAEYPLTWLDPENPPPLVAEWSPVYSLDVHPEGIWCVTGCKSGNINLWSVRHDEGHCQHVLREHRNAVSVLRLTPGERGLVSGSWDRSLVRWDLDAGKVVTRFQGVRSQITSLSFSPSAASSILAAVAAQQAAAAEDSMLMATSYDGAVLLFDQRVAGGIGRKFTAKLSEAPPWSLSACWSPNGDRIFCGRRNASVDEYDVREGRWVRSLRLPRDSGPVSFVACLPNSRHLLCASQDILRLWDLESSAADPDTILTPMDIVPYDVTPASLQSDQSSATHSLPLIDSRTHMDMAGVDTSSPIDTTTVPNEDTDAFSTLTDGALTKEDDFETAPLVPFTIVPGHNNGVVSTILIDPAKRYLITASGTRGWDGTASHLCLVYALVPVLSNNNNSNNNNLPATAPNPAAANTDASQPGMDVEESTDNNSGPAPISTRPTVLVGDEDEEDDEDD
ncbi:WD40-repeat-containing domain protein, partial [Powellomyces hirtus]